MAENRSLVVGDVTWDGSFLLHWLPANSLVLVILEVLNTVNTKLPHAVHGSFLDVSASVDIETKIENRGLTGR